MEKGKIDRRSDRLKKRWIAGLERQRMLQNKIRESAPDILKSKNFRSTKGHIQHGNMTVNDHCMNVARYSLALSRKLHVHCSERELIRGALLHDYFLYDWHDKTVERQKLHGFHHPSTALRNAMKEYNLTPREMEIIKKHMWPLTVVPPLCREAWIVTAADKWCSLMETVHLHKGHGRIMPSVEEYLKSEERSPRKANRIDEKER